MKNSKSTNQIWRVQTKTFTTTVTTHFWRSSRPEMADDTLVFVLMLVVIAMALVLLGVMAVAFLLAVWMLRNVRLLLDLQNALTYFGSGGPAMAGGSCIKRFSNSLRIFTFLRHFPHVSFHKKCHHKTLAIWTLKSGFLSVSSDFHLTPLDI